MTKTISIKQLSATEYDLGVKLGRKLKIDAHLRRETELPSRYWRLDVFDSRLKGDAAHLGTFDDAGCGAAPKWQAVLDILNDLVK